MQAEYPTDILFSSPKHLAPLYDPISRTAAVAPVVNKIASMRKSIYSLPEPAGSMRNANYRHIEFLSALDDPSPVAPKLERLSKSLSGHKHPYNGFNFFDSDDLNLLRIIARGEFNIVGFQNKLLRSHIAGRTSSKATRIIKRLRIHGIIRNVRGAYKYRLSTPGMQVLALGLKIREFFITPNPALC